VEEKRSKRSTENERPARARSERNRRRRHSDVEISRFAAPIVADRAAEFWDDDALDVTIEIPRAADSAPVLRLEGDVLAWFKSQGSDWHSRMNAVLRAHMTRARGVVRD
jgi:uncharacterized protein (DUF4415 family)